MDFPPTFQLAKHDNDLPDLAAIRRPCTTEINRFLFALDEFLPLIELGQERICRVRLDRVDELTFPPSLALPSMQDIIDGKAQEFTQVGTTRIREWWDRTLGTTTLWQSASAGYKLLGWIISSLLILSFTKTLRRSTGE